MHGIVLLFFFFFSCRPVRHVITVLGERMFEEVRERFARGEADQW